MTAAGVAQAVPRGSSTAGRLIATWVLAGLVALPALALGIFALQFWDGSPHRLPMPLDELMRARPVSLPVHTTAAGLALLLLPLMMVSGWRRRQGPHRLIGRAYGLLVLPAAIAAVPVALASPGGPWAGLGFVVQAHLWIGTLALGVAAIRRGDMAGHRRWMLRHAALTYAAVSLRALQFPALASGLDPGSAYVAIAWGSWLGNLAVAEAWLRFRTPGQRYSPAPDHRCAPTYCGT